MWHITTFYRFTPLTAEELPVMQSAMSDWLSNHGMLGLLLLAPEGINGTVCGHDIEAFKAFVQAFDGFESLRFKDSSSAKQPFQKLSVEIRREIVGLKRPDLFPSSEENQHLSPAEWHERLTSDTPHVLIDTRNTYETVAGKFRGAIDPGIENFADWGEYLDRAELQKDVPALIYCTGGIRCEKAILEMRARGFENVYQLRDGILGYLAEYPNAEFEGECFVFDERVTVGQNLEPSGNFGICPFCGTTAGLRRDCVECGSGHFVCPSCENPHPQVCSKSCLEKHTRPLRRKRA